MLNRTPFAQELRLTVDNWDPTKLKSVCAAKETFNLMKRKLAEQKGMPLGALHLVEDLHQRHKRKNKKEKRGRKKERERNKGKEKKKKKRNSP